jgi:hypothetical protein
MIGRRASGYLLDLDMNMKHILAATAVMAGLSVCAGALSPLASSAGAVPLVGTHPASNPKSTVTRVRRGGFGRPFVGGAAFRGFHPRPVFVRRRFGPGGWVLVGAPIIGIGLGAGLYDICYFNCREFHGPGYCSVYAWEYC